MSLYFSEVTTGRGVTLDPHARVTVKAKPGERFHLIDQATGKTPEDVKTHRQDDKLFIQSEKDDVEVILEDFWGECKPGSEQCYAIFDTPDGPQAIVTQDGNIIIEGAVIPQSGVELMLAGEVYTMPIGAGAVVPWGPLAFLVGAGLLVATTSSGGGSSPANVPGAPTVESINDGKPVELYDEDHQFIRDPVPVEVKLPEDAKAGDTLTVNGVERPLTKDDIDAGKVTVEVPRESDQNPDTPDDFDVVATVTNENGDSPKATGNAPLDTDGDGTPDADDLDDDGDGISDADETDPNGSKNPDGTPTDPKKWDTDGDGKSDGDNDTDGD
ncbi:MAG: hypothetical protein J6V99_01830, partial [Neisseriaceae bacterium]|nr:hypothetical protein [Neisseriaceae bacterium]